MWFKSIFLKTLRDYRVAILGWGLGLGLLMYAVLAAVSTVLGTPAARAALVSLTASFAWLAEPVKVDTAGGYATWKYGFTILILALWPLLVSSRLLRGEEERGSLDVLLSVPQGRLTVALQKLAAVWASLLAMGLLTGLLTFLGGVGVHADFGLGGALLFGLNLALICAVFGGIALVFAQFTHDPGTAAGMAGGALLLFIVLDMAHRVIPGTEWLSRLSPVYYYNLSKPLIPSYGVNVGALLVMLALTIILNGAALWLFVRRDVGATVALPAWLQPPTRDVVATRALPVNAWSLRSLYARSLAQVVRPALWWTLGIAGFAGWMIVVVKQTESKLAAIYSGSPILKDLLTKVGGGDTATNAALLSALFIILPLLLMSFAVTQASRWAADEENGRQELVLATPQPRLTVVLARFGALATATVLISVLTFAITALASVASGLRLDVGNLAAATLSMIPLGLLVAALGYLLAGWLRTAVDTGLLSFLLAFWFFLTFVGPELHWSGGVLRLSALYYYGTPLLHGLPLLDTLAVVAVGAVALALAAARFARKDIGR